MYSRGVWLTDRQDDITYYQYIYHLFELIMLRALKVERLKKNIQEKLNFGLCKRFTSPFTILFISKEHIILFKKNR